MLWLAEKEPFSTYDVLRKRGPIVWDPGMECWLALGYDLCRAVESDENMYRILSADKTPLQYEITGGRSAVSSLLGAPHMRMRRLYWRMLNPNVMPKYREEHVVPVINDAIDRFEKAGRAELVTEFADSVPARIMASMFGIPWRDDALLADIQQWQRDVVAWVGMMYAEHLTAKAKHASDQLNNLFMPLVRERRDNRADDLISAIWTYAPQDYGEVDELDVIAIVRDMTQGAGETTTNAVANAVYLYVTNPAIREAVSKDQQDALNALVEETLRLLPSPQWRFRAANQDVSLSGVAVRKDDKICLLHAAANRDPDHYACPHALDLHRERPTDHVAFNVGTRLCLGMHLARLQMRECLKALINRLPNLRLDPAAEAPRFRGFSHRSFGPQHVLF
ncbi:cytochrome P450 [Bradyrhizobium sp. BEA-2-5]|uniref:cytochrome P450 n=1 Tax=Bradyrhizobium sp. BEA-2-5 TaxID=3080015 RepID=UPI00293EBD4D|nr:cytochrome P450 [Bradyrhizobium sp. BEA-2-5]WOH80375.1 cytochrome P450 [Bradyrhizobium sp. BEA-2-5]